MYNVLPAYFNCQVCELPSNVAKGWRIDQVRLLWFCNVCYGFIICIVAFKLSDSFLFPAIQVSLDGISVREQVWPKCVGDIKVDSQTIITHPHAIFKNLFVIHYLSLSCKSAQNVNIFEMVTANICFSTVFNLASKNQQNQPRSQPCVMKQLFTCNL